MMRHFKPQTLLRRIPSHYRFLSSRTSDRLRILFCGSDDFSCASLCALDGEMRKGSGLIESIDVVVRPPKGTGRGYKKIREVPLKLDAERLGLPIHETDALKGFKPPSGINIIIAVSFGLFVPPEMLRAAKYGGLNLHPSFLPDLRGAAPLHHSLLQQRSHIGITLQTLDERKFDHGVILAQTPRPGIPIPPKCTVQELTDLVKRPAAELLVSSLQNGLHVPPLRDVVRGEKTTLSEDEVAGTDKVWRYAPKISKEDARIDWEGWTAGEAERRLRVLGPLWMEVLGRKGKNGVERVILRDAVAVADNEGGGEGVEKEIAVVWRPRSIRGLEKGEERTVAVRYVALGDGAVLFRFPRGGCLRVERIVVGGMAGAKATKALAPLVVGEGRA